MMSTPETRVETTTSSKNDKIQFFHLELISTWRDKHFGTKNIIIWSKIVLDIVIQSLSFWKAEIPKNPNIQPWTPEMEARLPSRGPKACI